MKLKNVSEKIKNFKKDGAWLGLNPGESTDLPACVLSNEESMEVVEEGKEKVPVAEVEVESEPVVVPEEEVPAEPEDVPKEVPLEKLSKSALKDLSEDEQVVLLKKYGVSDEDVEKLNRESKRVKALLKLQEEKDE